MAMKAAVMKKAAKAPMKKAAKAAMKKASKKPAMKAAMKVSKAMKKPMKAAKKPLMKKKVKKVSIIAKGKRAKASVFRGTKVKTSGGLTKDGLKKSSSGKIVSKAASDAAKKRSGFKHVIRWNKSFMAARAEMGIKGMVLPKKGTQLYALTKQYYDQQ